MLPQQLTRAQHIVATSYVYTIFSLLIVNSFTLFAPQCIRVYIIKYITWEREENEREREKGKENENESCGANNSKYNK